jgi:methylisocitrate lyase
LKTDARKLFRELVSGDEIITLVGAFDAFSAAIVQQAGFKAIWAGGSAIHTSMGYPDCGLATMTEILARVKTMTDFVKIPVIVDCDTGYGGPIQLMRTVKEFEAIGVAGIVIEDQPTELKRHCYKQTKAVSREEMVKKIEAAVEAREDKDFVIIARTDTRLPFGLEESLERGKLYAKAGADIVFPILLPSVEELRLAIDSIGAPIMTAPVIGYTSLFTVQELQDIGVKVILFSSTPQLAAGKTIQALMQVIKETGSDEGFHDRMMTYEERETLVGYPTIFKHQTKFIEGK